jgi:hypothetical protein
VCIRVEKPGFEGIETTRNFYDNKGQLVRKETPGRAATLYEYDALGHPAMTGLDVDGDGRLTPASMDRIAISKVAFKEIDDAWWQESHAVDLCPLTTARKKPSYRSSGSA